MEYFVKKYNIRHIKLANPLLIDIASKNLKDNLYQMNIRFFKKSNILGTKIQKNASSTIFLSLSVFNGNISLLNEKNPAQFQQYMSDSKHTFNINKIKLNCLNNIICFRNPKKRIVSLFLDKIVNNQHKDENSIRLLNKINKDYSKITFIDFLQFIADNTSTLNKLGKDQCSYILFNYYDYIFDVDRLYDTGKICPLYTFTHHSTSNKPIVYAEPNTMSIIDLYHLMINNSIHYTDFFTKDILELFNFIYYNDILLYDELFKT